jgi:hypothetical protein
MRTGLIVLWMLLCSITSAAAQVSIGIGLPGLSIGFNQPVYPQLVPVPGYPVYYAPQVNSNYFFYDGMYWLYQRDNWYVSSWYNGPWQLVGPEAVPLFVLRVPVRYYRRPPAYFHGWASNAPPHWGEHWGNAWEQGRSGWDTWNRSSVPPPAPLPVYQRQYSGNRYPAVEQQQALQSENYRYQSHEAVMPMQTPVRQTQSAPPSLPQGSYQERNAPQRAHGTLPPQKTGGDVHTSVPMKAPPQQRTPAAQVQKQQPQQAAAQQQRRAPEAQAQGKESRQARRGPAQEPKAQREKQQPQQAAAPHEPKAPRSQGEGKAPQVKSPAQEPKQTEGKSREQDEQRVAERHN